MKFNDYQTQAMQTAVYPDQGKNIVYPAMGLAAEAGEIAETVKGRLRDHGGVIDPASRNQILSDVGDMLWYCAAVTEELNSSLETVAAKNLQKLKARHQPAS